MPAPRICPSLLAADFANLGHEVDRMLDAGADWMHVDIMDGHFVPNISMGPPIVASLHGYSKQAFLDCHCMVSNPLQWVQPLASAGASQMTFHPESFDNLEQADHVIDAVVSAGLKCGLAIKPNTQLDDVLPLIEKRISSIETILVMTVEPGFGGQKFIHDMMDKVRLLRKSFPDVNIQVDGGLNLDTTIVAAEAGANCIVAGTAIFSSDDPSEMVEKLRQSVIDGNRIPT